MGWPTLGRAEIIGALPREVVAGYLESRYRPEKMIVAAAAMSNTTLGRSGIELLDRLPPH